jgi:hypothetical protein
MKVRKAVTGLAAVKLSLERRIKKLVGLQILGYADSMERRELRQRCEEAPINYCVLHTSSTRTA